MNGDPRMERRDDNGDVHFEIPKTGVYAGGTLPEYLCVSSYLVKLRESEDEGAKKAADDLEKLAAQFSTCPVHGKFDDPILGRVGNQLAFGCPQCSGPHALKKWREEHAANLKAQGK